MTKLKFLKASPLYSSQIERFYKKNPSMLTKSYQEQYDGLMAEFLIWSDSWKLNLERLGNYEVQEIITNCEPMQKAWAREHGLALNSSQDWQIQILEAQLDAFRPEIFFAHDYYLVTTELRKKFRQKFGIRLILVWDGIAFNKPEFFEGSDLIISCLPNSVQFYKSKGLDSLYLPLAFDSRILGHLNLTEVSYDLSFIGSLDLLSTHHQERLRLLAQVSRHNHASLFIAHLQGWQLFSKRQLERLQKLDWKNYFDIHEVGRKNRGDVFGIEMYQALAESKVTLNSHIDRIGNQAANFRLFEATGAGACLMTDWKENLNELFKIDEEVVTYKNTDECIDKIKNLLRDDRLRKAIADSGQKRTLKDHSYLQRMQILDRKLGDLC